MPNPWLDIPLGDYEAHMSSASVDQARMLADQFELLIARDLPHGVALVGCAGGNGLERIAPGKTARVVAVDINPEYTETVAALAVLLQLPNPRLQPGPARAAVAAVAARAAHC